MHIHTGLVTAINTIMTVIIFLFGARILIVKYPNNPFVQGLAFILG